MYPFGVSLSALTLSLFQKGYLCAASVTDIYPLHVSLFNFSLSPFLLSMTTGRREYPLGVSLFRNIPLRNGYNRAVADTRLVVAVASGNAYLLFPTNTLYWGSNSVLLEAK